MKKYIYGLLVVALLGLTYNDSYALYWYNPQWIYLDNSVCPEDASYDTIVPLPLSQFPTQARVSPTGSIPPGAGFRWCEQWDATPPSVSANNASSTWNKNNISITLSRSDTGGSGIGGAFGGSSSYKWNAPCSGGGASSFLNGSTIIQSTNGDHTLYLCGIDGAGNVTNDVAYGPYRHDHDLPTISATLDSTSWRNADITPIVISTGDTGGSGIRYAKYIWDSTDAICRASGTAVAGSISLTTEGAHILRLCIEDWAGNQASWTGNYNLDKTAPTVTADNSSPTWKNTAITINLGRADTGGSAFGVSKYVWHMNNIGPAPTLAFCLASGTPFVNGTQIFRNTSPDQGDHTLYLCAQDVAGNTRLQSFGPYRYDTVNPIVSANNFGNTWHNTNYGITMFASDPVPYAGAIVSDTIFAKRKYIWNYNNLTPAGTFTASYCLTNGTSFNDGFIFTLTTEGDHTLYICSEDEAGNRSTVWNGQYRLDKTNPTVSLLSYANAATNGWTNNTSITLNWSAIDLPAGVPAGVVPSLIKNYDINVYRVLGAQNTPTAANLYTTIPAASITTNYTYVGTNGYAYKFEVRPRDNANNISASWLASADIARIDTVVPDPAQLNDTSSIHMIANTSQAFNFSYNDGGAPVQISYTFEQNAAPGVSDSLVTPSYLYAHTYNRDISLVDNDRGANGGREWTIPVTQICDWASNCINTPSPLKTITHYSYADATNSTAASTSTGITDGTAIADGTSKIFETTIRDQFGNQLIPASGIGRAVNLTLSGITNTMYLNQYTRSGPTSIFLRLPVLSPIDESLNFITTQAFANPLISTNGAYPLQVKSYTPTANSYAPLDPVSDTLANFGFTANFVINDALSPTKTLSQTLSNPKYKPLYTSSILGNLRIGGFIEGTEQTSSITTFNNNAAAPTTALQLQLEFSGALSNNFNFYGSNTPGNTISIGAKNIMSPNPGLTPTNLFTTLVQKQNTQVSALSDIQFSTHYSYTLDGYNIVYNSDIIGRNGGYWSNNIASVGSQVGVKIIGSIGSNSISSIVTNQFAQGASIFDGYNRSNVRNSVRKSIALATRNSTSTTVAPTVINAGLTEVGGGIKGTKISNNSNESIIVLEKDGGAVTKVDLSLASGISGRRTIVVKGLDLYITNDMYYSSPDSILGIVVQKDENGNGGNLYINPTITNMVGSYIIDGSVMSSSNGISPIGTSNIGLLKNQLYIFGSIVSENTIGGSRILPLKCPSLVNTTCSTIEEAQKYDLNYLRRYYLYQGEPFGGILTNVIGGGTCSAGFCSGFNPSLIKKFNLLTEDYAKYPVIIEYNPLIRTKSPIGFEEILN